MVTIKEQKTIGPNGLTYYYFTGESTDVKPTGEYPEGSGLYVANGSVFYENDTGTRYEFNTDAEAYQVIGSVEELPPVTNADNGKVLSVVSGRWDKATPSKELPVVTSTDNGKILGVSDGFWGKTDVSKELPTVTSDDNGKVLSVVSGAWDKAEGGVKFTPIEPTKGNTTTINWNKSYSDGKFAHIYCEITGTWTEWGFGVVLLGKLPKSDFSGDTSIAFPFVTFINVSSGARYTSGVLFVTGTESSIRLGNDTEVVAGKYLVICDYPIA